MKKPNLLTNWIFSFVVLAGTSFSVLSKEAAIIDPKSRFHSVYGSSGMVFLKKFWQGPWGLRF